MRELNALLKEKNYIYKVVRFSKTDQKTVISDLSLFSVSTNL